MGLYNTAGLLGYFRKIESITTLYVLNLPEVRYIPFANKFYPQMFVEHLFFNCALAILVGMILTSERTGDNMPYTLIIIGSSWIPDIPTILGMVAWGAGVPVTIQHIIPGPPFLHNMAGLFGYTLLVGLLLKPFGFQFRFSALCGALGYGAHLLADSLTHINEYSLLWPISRQSAGIGTFFPYNPDFLGIAESRILVVSIFILALAIGFRTMIQGTGWIKNLFTTVRV